MNRYLPAGCAAVALAMGAGGANAQAKYEVKIGGDAFFEAGFVNQDRDSGLRSTEFRNRFRVNIIPTARADNGLEYGGRVRVRAAGSTTNVNADRAYIFVQGTFGQIRLGVSNSFNDETFISTPGDYLPTSIVDLDQVTNFVGSTTAGQSINPANGRYQGADVAGGVAEAVNAASIVWPSLTPEANATKILYFSPRFAGLQLGASYTPRNDSFNQDVNRLKASSAIANQGVTNIFTDLVEIGANYESTLAGFDVKASAGYYWGTSSDSTVPADSFRDLNAWQVGAQFGYAGFAVGGSYTSFGKSGQNKRTGFFAEDMYNWTAGVQYTTGPFVVGANYKYGVDPGSMVTPGSRRVQVYEVGAGYTVAPGLSVHAQYDYVLANSDRPETVITGSPDDKAHVIVLRTIMAF
ncbi:porin [Azospirillum canadense]|uniref:porin n=1 Tax=Azospirillum canadense TaxID=403962 RepID=UPI002226FA18|nr:porin [Azospirillum canadense]MCW2243113.1 putative porin [Azospirillum canadense]